MTATPAQRLSAIVPLPLADHAAAVFQPLAGQAPLARVVRDCLDAVADPARVVVSVAEHLAGDVRDLLTREGMAAVAVAVAEGPAARAQCLAAALEHVVSQPFSAPFVLVHDVRQPLTPPDLRDRVIARLVDGAPVVLPVLPVTDSVKVVDDRGAVITSLDRSTLQAVQFPRGFAADHLARLLAESAGEFDEAVAAIRSATPITTVDGDAEAVLAELPHDSEFLEALIASRRSC
ncbi:MULTISPECIES: 2-C-methyl-D-erythritol 4-phosphate cytidylyltransferase [unclassified Mycobacterium]|uniref:IspD/TarI family cytidylyltransferase n=1 Tax=unclassified Mycobacterium TaxID=2642494 RepID=UPI00074057CF|nr:MULTISPECIES: 2-C-methyl-D-erythritol 4-phosphate cytidylyltransferase [unclassified Mycobacterium]KUH80167.1 hypothetical protein AU185_11890 [Mycobacterium sp. GA-0227b]KUH81718.1 hypothetical protein AU186_11465 [Mycobacterium sp. GA-1999]KUH93999.1 hypothetical protein AU187_21345 [Mycobacterium sp. IS-1556]